MAFYYVKNGGTATGDAGRATTARTTSFTTMGVTTYYESILDVCSGAVPTTTITSGDLIMCSDLHDITHAAATDIDIPDGVRVYSVDDTSSNVYKRGAWERGLSTLRLIGSLSTIFSKGVSYDSENVLEVCAITEARGRFEDCELFNSKVGARVMILSGSDGTACDLRDVDINFAHIGSRFSVTNGGTLNIKGGSVLFNTTNLIDAGSNGGARVRIEDCDMSVCTGTLTDGGASSSDNVLIEVNRCKIGSGFGGTSAASKESFRNGGLKMTSCDVGDGFYILDHILETGQVTTETAIYRTLGATYDGTNNFSLEYVNDSTASVINPVEFELFNGWIDTADFTTDIEFKVHFAVDGSSVALDSDEFYIVVEHADGADNALGVVVSTEPDPIPLATGTAPTTETSLWTGLGGTNKQMSVSTTITIGTTAGTIASGVVRITAVSTNASQTVFVDPDPVIS